MATAVDIKQSTEERICKKYGISDYQVGETAGRFRRVIKSDSTSVFYNRDKASLCKVLFQGVEWLIETDIYGRGGWDAPERLAKGDSCGFYEDRYTKGQYPTTVEEIQTLVETHLQSIHTEAVEEYEYDPEDYMKYHRENPTEQHPWGDETIKKIGSWLHANPFEWYCVQEALKTHAQWELEDILLEMSRGADNGKELAESVEKKFDKLMETFVKGVEV